MVFATIRPSVCVCFLTVVQTVPTLSASMSVLISNDVFMGNACVKTPAMGATTVHAFCVLKCVLFMASVMRTMELVHVTKAMLVRRATYIFARMTVRVRTASVFLRWNASVDLVGRVMIVARLLVQTIVMEEESAPSGAHAHVTKVGGVRLARTSSVLTTPVTHGVCV